jgi:hypothetical protein
MELHNKRKLKMKKKIVLFVMIAGALALFGLSVHRHGERLRLAKAHRPFAGHAHVMPPTRR